MHVATVNQSVSDVDLNLCQISIVSTSDPHCHHTCASISDIHILSIDVSNLYISYLLSLPCNPMRCVGTWCSPLQIVVSVCLVTCCRIICNVNRHSFMNISISWYTCPLMFYGVRRNGIVRWWWVDKSNNQNGLCICCSKSTGGIFSSACTDSLCGGTMIYVMVVV
jgi:hypothetical protein